MEPCKVILFFEHHFVVVVSKAIISLGVPPTVAEVEAEIEAETLQSHNKKRLRKKKPTTF